MNNRRKRFKRTTEPENFWPSFTDMISTIALIIFFLMIVGFLQSIIAGNNIKSLQKQKQDIEDVLAVTQKKLDAASVEITEKEQAKRLLEDNIDELKAEVERGENALKLFELKVEEQKDIIAESNRELGNLRSRLEGVALFRVGILEKVKKSVEEEVGTKNDRGEPLVSIADNGNIVINEGLVFDFNKYDIKEDGKPLLDNLAKAFENVLNDSEIRNNIDAISIQGHTDEVGDPEYNRELSSRRAASVLNYIMSSNKSLETSYGDYFVASGYSEFRPINTADSDEARAQNRRIEISLILKDSNIQKVIDDYLKDSMEVFIKEEEE